MICFKILFLVVNVEILSVKFIIAYVKKYVNINLKFMFCSEIQYRFIMKYIIKKIVKNTPVLYDISK